MEFHNEKCKKVLAYDLNATSPNLLTNSVMSFAQMCM